jgi:hypothetical protein
MKNSLELSYGSGLGRPESHVRGHEFSLKRFNGAIKTRARGNDIEIGSNRR